MPAVDSLVSDPDRPISIEVVRQDDITTVVLAGAFDMASREPWDTCVRAVLGERPRRVCVDVAGVSFLDSSGLRCWVDLRRLAEDLGIDVQFVHVQAQTARLLDVTGTADYLGAVPDGSSEH